MKRNAIFPGSFDPITLGHYDIVIRALSLFDKIIIAIGNNNKKKYMFSIEKRKKWIKDAFKIYNSKIEVEAYEGLTVSFCKKKNINFILRGLRNIFDLEFEKKIIYNNKKLTKDNIETIFLLSSYKISYISSSIVRAIIKNGGNYNILVPFSVKL